MAVWTCHDGLLAPVLHGQSPSSFTPWLPGLTVSRSYHIHSQTLTIYWWCPWTQRLSSALLQFMQPSRLAHSRCSVNNFRMNECIVLYSISSLPLLKVFASTGDLEMTSLDCVIGGNTRFFVKKDFRVGLYESSPTGASMKACPSSRNPFPRPLIKQLLGDGNGHYDQWEVSTQWRWQCLWPILVWGCSRSWHSCGAKVRVRSTFFKAVRTTLATRRMTQMDLGMVKLPGLLCNRFAPSGQILASSQGYFSSPAPTKGMTLGIMNKKGHWKISSLKLSFLGQQDPRGLALWGAGGVFLSQLLGLLHGDVWGF